MFILNSFHGAKKVNQAYCVEILKRLREAVRRKRPELWPNDWILHHDKAPAHKTLSVKQFLVVKLDY
jgi:alpha-L-fucosidase